MDPHVNNEELSGGEADDSHQSNNHRNNDDDRSLSHTGDGASPGKIFIGGLSRDTTTAEFIEHFGKYGEITDSVIMKDRKTGQPRGFGFITYADPSVVDQVIQDTHIIKDKQVEIKRTIPRGAAGSKDFRTKKIFVGGIPSAVTDDELKEFFAQFGSVMEHQILRDHSTNRSRGFGFVTFEEEDAVDDLLTKGNRIEFAGTQVEIKKAEPKKPNPPTPSFKRYNDSRPPSRGGFNDSYGGPGGHTYGGGGGGSSLYRSGGAYGSSRMSSYGGYGAGEYGGGYGGYGGGAGGSGIGPYRGEPSVGYSGRYGGGGGGGYSRGYDMGGGYGGPADSYGGGYGGAPGGGYGSSYETGLGGGYGGGGAGGYGGAGGPGGGSFYGSRGGYGGNGGYGGGPPAGAGRYHPYSR